MGVIAENWEGKSDRAKKQLKARDDWEKEVVEWWEVNQLADDVEDPGAEAVYDAFAFIEELMKIRKRD